MEVNVGFLSIVLFFVGEIPCVVSVCLVWTLLLRLSFPQGGGCKRKGGAGRSEVPLSSLGMRMVAPSLLCRVVWIGLLRGLSFALSEKS